MAQPPDATGHPSRPEDHVDVEMDAVRTAHDGFLRVTVRTLRHRRFDGAMSPTLTRELMERGTSVCVLPYDPRTDRVLLIRQFLVGALVAGVAPRPLQVVAGMVGEGEDDEAVARREVMEEAGCSLKRVERAQAFLPSPGGTSERIVAFCGEADLSNAGGVHGLASENEDIRVEVVDADAAVALLDDGTIEAGPAVILLHWFARHRARLRAGWR